MRQLFLEQNFHFSYKNNHFAHRSKRSIQCLYKVEIQVLFHRISIIKVKFPRTITVDPAHTFSQICFTAMDKDFNLLCQLSLSLRSELKNFQGRKHNLRVGYCFLTRIKIEVLYRYFRNSRNMPVPYPQY